MKGVDKTLNVFFDCTIIIFLITILISSLSIFSHRSKKTAASIENWYETHRNLYNEPDPYRFNQFLLVVTDYHSPKFNSRLKESFNDHGIYYNSFTPGAKFSSAIYSGWFLGNYPTNYKKEQIKQQTLLDTLVSADYKLSYFGPSVPFSNVFDLSQISTSFKEEDHLNEVSRAFSWILGTESDTNPQRSLERWTSFLDTELAGGKSLILYSSVYSETAHIRPGFHPISGQTAKRIDADIAVLKEWSMNHPEVLLVIANDHHISFNGDASSYIDDGANDPFFIFYNPEFTGGYERFIHSCDFSANLVQYLNNVQIPLSSIGIPNLDGESDTRIQNSLKQGAQAHLDTAQVRGIKLKNRVKLAAQTESIDDNELAYQNLLISRKRLSSRTSLPIFTIIICYFMLIFAVFNLLAVAFFNSPILSNIIKRFKDEPAVESPVESIIGARRSTVSSEQFMVLPVPKYVVVFAILVPFSFLVLPKTPSISCTDLVILLSPLFSLITIYYLPYYYRSRITQMVIVDAAIALVWRVLSGDDMGDGAFDQFLNGPIVSHLFYLIYFGAIYFVYAPQNLTTTNKAYHTLRLGSIFVVLLLTKLFLDTKKYNSMYVTGMKIHTLAFLAYFSLVIFIIVLVATSRYLDTDTVDIIMPLFLFIFILLSATPSKQIMLLYVLYKWMAFICPALSTLRYHSSLVLNLKGFLKIKINSQLAPKQSILSLSHMVLSEQNISYYIILVTLSSFMMFHDLLISMPVTPSFSIFIPGGKVGIKSSYTLQKLSFIGMILHDYGIFIIILFMVWAATSGVFSVKRARSKPIHKIFTEFQDIADDSIYNAEFTAQFPFSVLLCPNHYFSSFLFCFAIVSNILLLTIMNSWHSGINFEIPFAVSTLLTVSSIIVLFGNMVTFIYRWKSK